MDQIKLVEDAVKHFVAHPSDLLKEITPGRAAAGLAVYLGLKTVVGRMRASRHYRQVDLPEVEGQHWLYGAIPLIKEHGGEIFKAMEAFFDKYGNLFKMSFFGRPVVVVANVEALREIMVKSDFPKGSNYGNLHPLLGRGVVFIDGEEWKFHRKAINPGFGSIALKTLQPTFAKLTAKLVKVWTSHLQSSSMIDFSDAMTKLTLDIIAETGFSYPLNALDNENLDLGEAFALILRMGTKPWIHMPYGGHIGKWYFRRELGAVNKIIFDTIKRRMAERKEGKTDRPDKDFLDLLMDSADKGTGRKLNLQEIRDEVFILFLAGHETTATTLTWAMVRAMQNPDMYERLVAEAEAVLGERDVPTYDDISKFKYMNAFLKETLRLHPPATQLSRRTPADVKLAGHFVPKGTDIFVSPYLIQRDPAWWRDPLTFKPERFLSTEDGGSEEYRAPSEPMTFIPFTAGPRVCAGQNFFWIEGQTIFPALLKAFRFKPSASLKDVQPTVKTGTMKTNIPVILETTLAHP